MVPKTWEQITLVVTHPDFAETSATIQPGAPDAQNSVITMPAGFSVAGPVKNALGHPVQGASVREVRMNSEGEHSKTTDAWGTFEFRGMKSGELMLAVQAEGYAPSVQTLQVTGSLAAVGFTLGPGHLLRGHIIDEAGHPVPNAFVETTRRASTKSNGPPRRTPRAGFEWASAPEEPLLYSVCRKDSTALMGYPFKPTAPITGQTHDPQTRTKTPSKSPAPPWTRTPVCRSMSSR